MRELTKAERHEVYKLALDGVHERYNDGAFTWMCPAISEACTLLGFSFKTYTQFPEFHSKKPETANMISWFPVVMFNREQGYNKRIELLTQCIAETAPC